MTAQSHAAGRVAVRQDGEVVVHMDGHSSYDTLCGIDADDDSIGHEPADVPGNGRARIDCPDCWAIWRESRRYTRRDFSAAIAKATGEAGT